MGKTEFNQGDAFQLGNNGETVFHFENRGEIDPALELGVEIILRTELKEKSCYICGDGFEEKDLPTAVSLGNLTSSGSSDLGHKRCFERARKENPQIEPVVGKPPREWSGKERRTWIEALSTPSGGSTYSKLFGNK